MSQLWWQLKNANEKSNDNLVGEVVRGCDFGRACLLFPAKRRSVIFTKKKGFNILKIIMEILKWRPSHLHRLKVVLFSPLSTSFNFFHISSSLLSSEQLSKPSNNPVTPSWLSGRVKKKKKKQKFREQSSTVMKIKLIMLPITMNLISSLSVKCEMIF